MLDEYGIELVLTENCKACCSYCYQGKNHRQIYMSEETAFNIINKVKDDPKFDGYINFFGGEPTLCYDLVSKIIDTYPKFKYSIVSNGRFIYDTRWDEYISKLTAINISIEVNDTDSWNQRRIKDLRFLIDKVCSYNTHSRFTIVVGDHLIDKKEDLLDISQYIMRKGANLYYYTNLKPDTKYDNKEFIKFLYWFKEQDMVVYKKLINYEMNTLLFFNHESNQQCDLEEVLHFNTDGSLLPCGQYIGSTYNKVYYYDIDNMLEYLNNNINTYAIINKENKFNCNKCIIKNKSHCNICNAVIDTIKDDAILYSMCERNKLIHLMRMELIGDLEVAYVEGERYE